MPAGLKGGIEAGWNATFFSVQIFTHDAPDLMLWIFLPENTALFSLVNTTFCCKVVIFLRGHLGKWSSYTALPLLDFLEPNYCWSQINASFQKNSCCKVAKWFFFPSFSLSVYFLAALQIIKFGDSTIFCPSTPLSIQGQFVFSEA